MPYVNVHQAVHSGPSGLMEGFKRDGFIEEGRDKMKKKEKKMSNKEVFKGEA